MLSDHSGRRRPHRGHPDRPRLARPRRRAIEPRRIPDPDRLPDAAFTRPRSLQAAGRTRQPRRMRRPRRRPLGADHPAGSQRDRGRAAGNAALRNGGSDRAFRTPGSGAGRRRHGVGAACDREFRFLRLPRPQPRRRRPIEPARSRQCARHSLGAAQGWPHGAAGRCGRTAGVSRRHEGRRVQSLHHRARPGLGRLPRGPYPRGSRRAPRRLPPVPMGPA